MLDYLKNLPHQRAYFSDRGCACCGARLRRHFRIIWDELSNEWGLTPELRKMIDQREGTLCAFCKSPTRARHLARALLDDLSATKELKFETLQQLSRARPADLLIAEINEIPGVHKYLTKLPGIVYSEYGGPNSEDLMGLSYDDETFDYVLTSDTLEHVPDFDRALSETRRVLKPGGVHILSIPIIWERSTRQRASVTNGIIVHHFPPSHHGKMTNRDGDFLVFNEFGGDVISRIESAGFALKVGTSKSNPTVITISARRLP